jgi:hypothetical protein
MRKATSAALLFATVIATGCGGNSGSAGTSTAPGSTTTTPQSTTIAGPLDTVQSAVTNSVIGPLVGATQGTPLADVLRCGNSVLTQNALDVADAFANGLANPSTLISTTPVQAQAALGALVSNLSGLLASLGSTTVLATPACTGFSGGTIGVPTTNPLAGTPLAALGAALLPALTSAQQQLAAGAGGTTAVLGATQLASILSMLNTAFNQGLSQLPSSVTSAPIVGGVLVSVQSALTQLTTIANAAASGASATAIAADLQALAQSVLNNLLTTVLPVGTLQGAAGGTATANLVTTLQAAVAALTGSLSTNPTMALPVNPLGAAGFSSLAGLVSQLQSSLPTALLGTAGNTPLTSALGAIQTLLNSLLATGTGNSPCPLHFLGLC